MKYTNLLSTLALIVLSTSTLQAAQAGETLYTEKCAMCHINTRPDDKSTLIAPPIMGVMRHVKMTYPTKEEAVAFMTAYVLEPQKEKAVCRNESIQRFGLMPSQKGAITEAELKTVSAWLYDNYPRGGAMQKEGKNCQQ